MFVNFVTVPRAGGWRIIDGLVSGLHVHGESHFELLSAFAPRALLVKAIALAAEHGMSGHELGDACLVL
jgi:S-adenosylmethionine:tRNA ribosyltransferase-isomerase